MSTIPSAITFLVECWRIRRTLAEERSQCQTAALIIAEPAGSIAAIAGLWRNPEPDETQTSFCEIRGVAMLADHWTYCQNWHTRTRSPIGPIYSSGAYEGGYRRIPWHGLVAPDFIQTGVCSECVASIDDGISIPAVESAPLSFCCNLHYLQWSQRQHPNEEAPMSGDIWEH